MGNKNAKIQESSSAFNPTQKQKQYNKEELTAEWARKKNNKIILVLGDSMVGKTTIIDKIRRIDHVTHTVYKSTFMLESFTIQETCHCEELVSSKNLKHPYLVYNNIKEHNWYHINFKCKPKKESKIRMETEVIINAYIHYVFGPKTFPNDIIGLLMEHYMNHISILESTIFSLDNIHFKYGRNAKNFELWELSSNDHVKWNKLYKYSSAIIFVVDLSCYDQDIYINNIDGKQKKINKMSHSLNLFKSMIKCCNFSVNNILNQKVIVYFNKYDIFQRKIMKIPLNRCKEFEVGTVNIDWTSHDIVEIIKDKFAEIGCINSSATISATNMNKKNSMLKIWRNCTVIQSFMQSTYY